MIRSRHVFYVEGYDPQGAPGYYALFRREYARFLELWRLRGRVGELESEPAAHAARWRIETEAPNWQVSTVYEFLSWDDIIARDMARPMGQRVVRTLLRLANDIATGTTFRIFAGSWRFGLFYLYPVLGLALWFALALVAGWIAARISTEWLAAHWIVAAVVGLAVAYVGYRALRPWARRYFFIQLAEMWLLFHDHRYGRRQDFEQRIDHFARRLIAAAHDGADEIVVVGHSGGGVTAPLVMARALALDPDLCSRGPRLVLLTLGSVLPAVAMHPRADALRETLKRLSRNADLLWMDCQARADPINFFDFDPIVDVGIEAGPARRNPVLLLIRFRDNLAAETYERFRLNFFRIHFQFIMANDLRAPFDYFFYLCGPLPIALWSREERRALTRFASDGALVTAVEAQPAT